MRFLPALALAAGVLVGSAVSAGEYAVSPLRITLDRKAPSGVVTLANSGDENIDFQASVLEWTQDADGNDRYTPTSDAIFFPKILTLKPGESRVIRIGVQALPVATERTFRIFIDPLPQRGQEAPPPGAHIAVNMRFALPIFAKPVKPEARGDIDDAAWQSGKLSMTVRNTGNEHLRFDDGLTVTGLDAQGREVLSHRIEMRYVLAGAARQASYTIPKDVCARIATLDVAARAEQLTLSRKLAAGRASCE